VNVHRRFPVAFEERNEVSSGREAGRRIPRSPQFVCPFATPARAWDFPLREFFIHHKPDRAEVFIADLISDIRKFTESAAQSDDITALYLQRTS